MECSCDHETCVYSRECGRGGGGGMGSQNGNRFGYRKNRLIRNAWERTEKTENSKYLLFFQNKKNYPSLFLPD
jgi:hypothetical protein